MIKFVLPGSETSEVGSVISCLLLGRAHIDNTAAEEHSMVPRGGIVLSDCLKEDFVTWK
jgi:hypothetical protein